MTKILMVCLGNICRSPVAEGIMRDTIEKNNLNASVDSAGTAAYHTGEAPDHRSQANARKNGIDIGMLRARQFTAKDFENFDRIYVMDDSNYENVYKLARNNPDKEKIKFILEEVFPGKNLPVPDPYYGGEQGFEDVFKLLKQACEAIAEQLQKK